MPSPRYRFGGNFMKSRTTSYLMSGASMALGRSLNWACVRWSGGVGTSGAWAVKVVAADSDSAAATRRVRRIFIGHLDGGATCSSCIWGIFRSIFRWSKLTSYTTIFDRYENIRKY